MPYIRKRRPIRHTPTFNDAALNITFQCNLACVGCDRASFIKPYHSEPMTVERLESFFEEVQSTGIELRRMRIVGGEPTLHPDFAQMTSVCMAYARSTGHRCSVRVFSNQHTRESRTLLEEAKRRHRRLEIRGAHKLRSAIFPKLTRFEYVSPQDAGIECPFPCPNMGGRGKCGSGVDQVGYSLCPTAGPIDSILQLGARATKLSQMLDPEFVQWQAETICSRCGNFMAYSEAELPRLWYCNGTPVSAQYRAKLLEAGFPVTEKRHEATACPERLCAGNMGSA